MKKFINQALAGILALSCMTLPVSAEYETDPEETSPTWAEESESEENAAAESEEAVLVEEESPEGQGTEEAETAEEALPEETEVIEEDLPEETTVPEEETAEPEEVSLITLDPVSYNGLTISVSYDSDTFGGKTVEITVGDPGEAENAALEDLGQFKAVDITFVDEEGNPVQPEEGKSVSVVLKAEEMEGADDYKVVHVEGNGQISFLDADVSSSNTVTKKVKTGETTTIVTVPEETEKVLVNDYKDEPYNTFEIQKQEVEVPAIIGYRFVRKSKVVKTGNSNKGLGKNTSKSTARVLYYLELEPYEIRAAYTKIVNVRVPVTKSRKVLVGSHYETKVVKDAYTYEKTEDVYSDVTYSDVEASFTAGSFSVYAIVVVDPDGGIDFDETFGSEHITVKAPAGAFAEGTVMKIEMQDDPEVLANALKALEDNSYSFHAIDISFWKDEAEVEPRLPVEVTWTSDNIKEGDRLVHIKDDGTAELVSATVEDNKAVFTARDFSTYTTTRLSEIDLTKTNSIRFKPDSITRPSSIPSGEIASTHPEFEGYTFVGAYVVRGGSSVDESDPVIYLGAFIYNEWDDEGHQTVEDEEYVYYRTESTAGDSDLIVKLADDEMIQLTYEKTPYTVTYNVVYNGYTYTIGEDELPADLADLVFTGPDAVAENTEYSGPLGVKVELPRGYSSTIRMSNESTNQQPSLGEYSEPNYSCTDNWNVLPDNYPFVTKGTYTIDNVMADLTVTLTVTKRNSYRFTAQPAFDTAYFGSTGSARYQNVTPRATYTFNGNTTTFRFTTASYSNVTWAMDGLNINKQAVLVPFVDNSNRTASTTTTLESGTVITVTAEYLGGTYPNRRYTIEVSNCYENITITGGNLHNVTDKPEWVLQEKENIAEFYYGVSGTNNPLIAGEPMTYDGWQNYNSSNAAWTAWRNNTMVFTPRSIRFKVAEGYVNPQIKYVTPEGRDDYSRVGDVTLSSQATDQYHLVTSDPDANGFYWFSLKGNSSSTYMGLLSVRAELARYGVSYDKGTDVTDATVPAFDDGGRYGDGSLQGYNIIDNQNVIINKSAPVDNNGQYIFMYYTIDGDGSGTHYAPSQKIPLSSIAEFGEYDSEKDEYVIPFVAHWEKKEDVDYIDVTADIYLDGVKKETVHTTIPLESSVYIDIDSDTMKDFMGKYNWQLFYDEVDSDPFITSVNADNNHVEVYVYSKFYVYHSSTGTLELHTTKELEKEDGTIGTLDITKLVNSGYLYGGYYTDYEGAHDDGGTNLVKAAADFDNNEGTLTTDEIQTLHNGGAVEIATVGTEYDPATNEDHVGYWDMDQAFTNSLTTPSSDWYSDRGENDPDVATDTTGGAGTEVKVARAGIYYIKEVPNTYLRPTHITTYQRYDRYLRDFILLSTTDDENYLNAGFLIGSNYFEKDVITDKLTIEFGPNYDETVVDGKVDVEVTNASSNAGGLVTAYRLFHLEDESNKDYTSIIGTKSFKPYWITPDGITVTGAVMRRETVKDAEPKDGIIRVDSADGEITFRDIAAKINAFKQ